VCLSARLDGCGIMESMHTHFASATSGGAAFLSVLVFGTFWRIVWLHGLTSSNRHVAGLSRAALAQF
jgi:hypothetical protein